jgi:NAD(P)-dependent dehydrogenase (short-subunit alcohol dehydrogenase family)
LFRKNSASTNTKPLLGRTCVITGPTHGIGRVTALALGQLGARLLLLCRDVKKGQVLIEDLRAFDAEGVVIPTDLSSLKSVAYAASTILNITTKIDILINNAATINRSRKVTEDGLEEMFAVNYLAHFLLTKKLLLALESAPTGRIVNVASGAYKLVPKLFLQDYNWEHLPFHTFRVYGHSKLACLLFNYWLARRLEDTNVVANAVDPGAVSTGLGRVNTILKIVYWLCRPFFLTPEQGSETSIYLASDASANNYNGEYFVKCKPAPIDLILKDDSTAEQLWDLSERLVVSF